jgi:hypothetical protein
MKDKIKHILSEHISEKVFNYLQEKYKAKVHTIDFEIGEKIHYRVDNILLKSFKNSHVLIIEIILVNEDGSPISLNDIVKSVQKTVHHYYNQFNKGHHAIMLIEMELKKHFETLVYDYLSLDKNHVGLFVNVDYEE